MTKDSRYNVGMQKSSVKKKKIQLDFFVKIKMVDKQTDDFFSSKKNQYFYIYLDKIKMQIRTFDEVKMLAR